MGKWKVGVLVDNLKIGIGEGIEKAAELGADGVQIFCTEGEMLPGAMDAEARKAFRRKLDSFGLALSALCGDTFKGFEEEKRCGIRMMAKRVLPKNTLCSVLPGTRKTKRKTEPPGARLSPFQAPTRSRSKSCVSRME